ncbi:MAG: PDZ domain-containing protein [Clostridia bacterium]|nr:PDZ domain-containing protein [Clostridia bacterium]
MSDAKDSKIQYAKRALFAVVMTVFALSLLISLQGFQNDVVISFDSGERVFARHNSPAAFQDVQPTASGADFVHISGKPIGIAIKAGGLIVVGDGGVKTKDGEVYPSRNLVANGDVITAIDGEKVDSIYQLKRRLDATENDEVVLTVERNGETKIVKIKPATERISGQKKLGLALKEDVGGIGTLTFVTQNGGFAALGHYINDAETGLEDELDEGNIYETEIESVEKGEIGKAGGLIASVNRLSSPIGKIKANTNIGLYGVYTAETEGAFVKVASKGEAQPGRAQVLTTVEGDEPKFYDIEIVKVISQSSPGDKGMVIMVRDRELLEKTGGIVQGMSGSPIVQNGVLVGAVTHVFIQDPTRGYAVHARFMLDEANRFATEKTNDNGNLTVPNIEDIDLAA